MPKRKIEFNNGFITALGLFYGHREQWKLQAGKGMKFDMRIYGASDHLFGIQYPKKLDKRLKKKIEVFVSDILSRRLRSITWEEGDELFNRCYKLLMEIDKKYFGLKKIEVNYP